MTNITPEERALAASEAVEQVTATLESRARRDGRRRFPSRTGARDEHSGSR
ncbi:hypothetical protein [Natrarchaeobius chitinivorans]|uniref:hypothetical protein n=1 Tax=Natrarchaeobius chitinivorans TaxID=1679083 RepID=UPI0014049446|nr:hypothetical protein [Natrarchaeobius chitinivorans]